MASPTQNWSLLFDGFTHPELKSTLFGVLKQATNYILSYLSGAVLLDDVIANFKFQRPGLNVLKKSKSKSQLEAMFRLTQTTSLKNKKYKI